MKKINIITVDNNGGLTSDAKILKKILQESGFKVSVFEVGKPTIGHKLHRIYTYGELFLVRKLLRLLPMTLTYFCRILFLLGFPMLRLTV